MPRRGPPRRPAMNLDSRPGRQVVHQGPAPDPIDVPQSSESNPTARLVPMRNPPPADLPDAPPPPPGYCYDLAGHLRPLMKGQLPLSEPGGKEVFLEVLELTGSVRTALDAIGVISPNTLEYHLQRDPEFEQRYTLAMERHRSAIYAAAHQRAVYGYDVPVIGGIDRDQVVAYERRYSDTLMKAMLNRHFPEFRESRATTVNVDARQVNVEAHVDLSKLDRKQREHLRALLKELPAPQESEEPDGPRDP